MSDHPIRFLRLTEFLRRVPYSEAHIWRLEKSRKIPPPCTNRREQDRVGRI